MMKLFNFPDDRTKEAETENRPPGAPPSHERQPAAAGLSRWREGAALTLTAAGWFGQSARPAHAGGPDAERICKYSVLYCVYMITTLKVWIYVL